MAFLKNISPDTITASDQELVAAYRQSSDLTILAALYQRYMDLLYGVCLKYLRDPEIARDAVMSIFEELVHKLRQHEVEHFKGWVYTLAKNHCLMQLRSSNRVKVQAFDPENMQSAEELHLNGIMEKEEHLDRMSKCLETLSADQKTVIELFYLQNKCYNEIKSLTGLDWNKVRSHIQNGRRNLKICMERQTTDPAPVPINPYIGQKNER
ncbi:MAG TPA: sigma-70 family RNA polymerase sigma factor [Puia sp.]